MDNKIMENEMIEMDSTNSEVDSGVNSEVDKGLDSGINKGSAVKRKTIKKKVRSGKSSRSGRSSRSSRLGLGIKERWAKEALEKYVITSGLDPRIAPEGVLSIEEIKKRSGEFSDTPRSRDEIDKAQMEMFLQSKSWGYDDDHAMGYAKITPHRLNIWKRNPEFIKAYYWAATEMSQTSISNISKAIKGGDVDLSKRWLEKREKTFNPKIEKKIEVEEKKSIIFLPQLPQQPNIIEGTYSSSEGYPGVLEDNSSSNSKSEFNILDEID